MPRQDYSLPCIVPLPLLAKQSRVPAPVAQLTLDTSPVVFGSGNQQDSEAEDDYDMLNEDDDILDWMGPLVDKVETLHMQSSKSVKGSATLPTDAIPSNSAPTTADQSTASSFVDMLLRDIESEKAIAETAEGDSAMTTTANDAPTFASSGDARLDFFFEVLKDTDTETIQRLVRRSWAVDPLDTLRLIFQLRSVIHGKGERKEFYVCMDFLRKEHPKTLLYNLRFIPDHGYWKDLLNWLVFEIRDDPGEYTLASKSAKENGRKRIRTNAKPKTTEKRHQAIMESQERNHQLSMIARIARLEKAQSRLERARSKFRENAFYRALHLEVARLFANALVRDKARMQKDLPISLAAKWCPSLGQFHDSRTLIASTIAQILYPDKLSGESHVNYVNRVRQLLRQEYYVPLRKATPVLETMMAARCWGEINYSQVPAIAMKKHKGLFEAYDRDRFEQYLDSVAKGETAIAAQALQPHQLVMEAGQLYGVDPSDLRVKTMEAQWKSYVDRLAQKGTMNSAMAMCDVSGSMSGVPMEVAIALSLLLAQLSLPPFNQLILTFSEAPQIHRVKEGSLMEKVQSLKRMDWGMNTDLAKAFNHILTLAVENKVAKEDMVKTLFIFSDMEFDKAVQGRHFGEVFTNYSVIKARFEREGYCLPQIVFWNLRGSSRGNKPVKVTQEGVSMVSGFSGMLMKLFLEGDDLDKTMEPLQVMFKSIHAKEFCRLRVLD
ncbi:hypothetical protein BG011_005523 [Mortierella polycephala]|uniref:Uncharacterized protein n=1 Tax=Mortierella polycephala TaxID=41804 RepID=A0A9P6PYT2_9FUNG|nr:hypothetical protein BG011_005523 [Mortierella polycephala]